MFTRKTCPIFHDVLSPFLGNDLRNHSASSVLVSPSPILREAQAAAVALATLQDKLVALGPSVPNLGRVEAVGFLFLFGIPRKSDFIFQLLAVPKVPRGPWRPPLPISELGGLSRPGFQSFPQDPE